MIDWTKDGTPGFDELVVRAAVPNARSFCQPVTGVHVIVVAERTYQGLYSETLWAEARWHPTVRAWEEANREEAEMQQVLCGEQSEMFLGHKCGLPKGHANPHLYLRPGMYLSGDGMQVSPGRSPLCGSEGKLCIGGAHRNAIVEDGREGDALRSDLYEVRDVVTSNNFAEMQQRAEAAEAQLQQVDDFLCGWNIAAVNGDYLTALRAYDNLTAKAAVDPAINGESATPQPVVELPELDVTVEDVKAARNDLDGPLSLLALGEHHGAARYCRERQLRQALTESQRLREEIARLKENQS